MADIINSYDNTDELAAQFPCENPTYVADGIGRSIQNRLLTGFANWNRGFDAWKAWGDILYTPDSIYNVHGARLTLGQYQAAMNVILKKVNIQLGAFHNMIICDDWTAIFYDTTTIAGGVSTPASVMEFVNFRDYGDPLGTRVVEGWGGPKDEGYAGMAAFQDDAQRAIQKKNDEMVLNHSIPDTADLAVKYPVLHPTTDHSEWADEIRMAILRDIDAWNSGYEAWAANVDEFYSPDATATDAHDRPLALDQHKDAMRNVAETQSPTVVLFDSMLISGQWAAIHFRTAGTDPTTGAKDAGERMMFLHFAKDGGELKADASWTK